MNNIEPKEFILNYVWNNDDEHHCYKESTGFVIKVDYDADKYLIEGLEGFGDCTDEIGRIETKQDLYNFLDENYTEVAEEYRQEIDDLIEKLGEEIQEEAEETYSINASIEISCLDLKKFCDEHDYDYDTERKYALARFIEDAMEDKDVDLAFFNVRPFGDKN